MQITADTIHNKQHSISKWYRMAYTMILILTISTTDTDISLQPIPA